MEPRKKIPRVPRRPLNSLTKRTGLIGAEIGVQFGLHAEVILTHLDIEKLYLVDPYKQYLNVKGRIACNLEQHEEIRLHAHDRLAKYNARIVWLEMLSSDAAYELPDDCLDFVYIDGDHRYEFVKSDIELYLPKVKSGGYIAGHDYGRKYNGVKRAVAEVFGSNFQTRGVDWWATKD